jgi:hypothetical protein
MSIYNACQQLPNVIGRDAQGVVDAFDGRGESSGVPVLQSIIGGVRLVSDRRL